MIWAQDVRETLVVSIITVLFEAAVYAFSRMLKPIVTTFHDHQLSGCRVRWADRQTDKQTDRHDGVNEILSFFPQMFPVYQYLKFNENVG